MKRPVDVDISRPESDEEESLLTLPAELVDEGYVHDRSSAQHPSGLWVIRSDGKRILVPWPNVGHPSDWDVL